MTRPFNEWYERGGESLRSGQTTDYVYGFLAAGGIEGAPNFWIAVSKWLPDAWRQPSKYIVFKGMGLYLVSHIGIDVIDRCVIKGEYKPADRVKYLNTSRERSIPSFSGNLT